MSCCNRSNDTEFRRRILLQEVHPLNNHGICRPKYFLEHIKDVNSLNVINEANFFFNSPNKTLFRALDRGYHLLFHSTVLEGVPIFSYSGVLWEVDCKNQGISFFILHSSWNKESQEAALGQLNSAVSDQKPPSLVIQLKKSEVLLLRENAKNFILFMKLQE